MVGLLAGLIIAATDDDSNNNNNKDPLDLSEEKLQEIEKKWNSLSDKEKQEIVEEARERAKIKSEMLKRDEEEKKKKKQSTTAQTNPNPDPPPPPTTTPTTTKENDDDNKKKKSILAEMMEGLIDDGAKAKIRQQVQENREYLLDMEQRRQDEPYRRIRVVEFVEEMNAFKAQLEARTPISTLKLWIPLFIITFCGTLLIMWKLPMQSTNTNKIKDE
jgi:hypothetical protein